MFGPSIRSYDANHIQLPRSQVPVTLSSTEESRYLGASTSHCALRQASDMAQGLPRQ